MVQTCEVNKEQRLPKMAREQKQKGKRPMERLGIWWTE